MEAAQTATVSRIDFFMRTVYHKARTLALAAVATGRHGGVPGKHRSRDRGGAQGRGGKVNYCFGNDAETLKKADALGFDFVLCDDLDAMLPHFPTRFGDAKQARIQDHVTGNGK